MFALKEIYRFFIKICGSVDWGVYGGPNSFTYDTTTHAKLETYQSLTATLWIFMLLLIIELVIPKNPSGSGKISLCSWIG